MGSCQKVVAFVRVKLEFSIGSLCTQFFDCICLHRWVVSFFNQCSLPLASLMGMTAFITFNVED